MMEPGAPGSIIYPGGSDDVPTLLPGFTPEQVICEGWVQKESRYRVEWRARWLVLYRDRATKLPVLCTFKEARCNWDWVAGMPEPTERIFLTGCSCGIQADDLASGSLDSPVLAFTTSLSRSVRSLSFNSITKAAPAYVFTVSSQAATFAFATESTCESQRWVGAISRGIAEAAMLRGGVPCLLAAQTPTAQTQQANPLPEYTKVAGAAGVGAVAAAAAGAAHGATARALLERRNAQLEEQVQQLQGALGAMLLGELAAQLEELGMRKEELHRQLDEVAAAADEAAGAGAAGAGAAGAEAAGAGAAGSAKAGHADSTVARESRDLAAERSSRQRMELEAELASVASQSALVRQRMEHLASRPAGGSPVPSGQPTVTEATDEDEGLSPSYMPFGVVPGASHPRPTTDATPGCDLDTGAICDEVSYKETGEYVPFGAHGLAPTDPLVSSSEPWQLVVAAYAAAEGGDGEVQQQAVVSRDVFAERRVWRTSQGF